MIDLIKKYKTRILYYLLYLFHSNLIILIFSSIAMLFELFGLPYASEAGISGIGIILLTIAHFTIPFMPVILCLFYPIYVWKPAPFWLKTVSFIVTFCIAMLLIPFWGKFINFIVAEPILYFIKPFLSKSVENISLTIFHSIMSVVTTLSRALPILLFELSTYFLNKYNRPKNDL